MDPIQAPDLQALVSHYQERLRLRDWRIEVSYQRDLTNSAGQPVWGLCMPIADAKVAKIIIRDPSTPPGSETPEQAAREVEDTIVHELVHLHFAPFEHRSVTAVIAEEQAVWALAEALVAARGTPQEQVLERAIYSRVASFTKTPEEPTPEPPPERSAVAAGEGTMDPKLVAEALDALTAGDDAKCAEILKGILVASASGGEAPPPEGEPPAEAVAPPPPEDEEPKPEVYAAARRVAVPDDESALGKIAMSLIGETSAGAAAPKLARAIAIANDIDKREADLAKSRKVLEQSERRDLVAKLVVAGEKPATAWEPDKDGIPDGKTPAEPWASMAIEKLRARVAKLSKPSSGARLAAPVSTDAKARTAKEVIVNGVTVQLSAAEVKRCESRKANLERYAEIKLRQGITTPVTLEG